MSSRRDPSRYEDARRELLESLLRREGRPVLDDDPIRPSGRVGTHAMSFAQQRLWFLERLSPGNPFYNVQTSIRHRGALDLRALERAVAAVVERHRVLGGVFRLVDGEPV
jgi:hypothetical protein